VSPEYLGFIIMHHHHLMAGWSRLDEAVLVGPPVMYRAVVEELRKKGLGSDRIVVSLERHMRCGVGKCGHCAIEHLYCCQDGPVFWLNEIENLKGAL